MKRTFAVFMAVVFGVAVAVYTNASAHTSSPSTFTTFSNGQVLTASTLNANFAHLHNTLTGSITDANISALAAIQHGKLAMPLLVAKAFAVVGTNTSPCTGVGGTLCSVPMGQNVVSARTGTNAGEYIVTLSFSIGGLTGPLVTPFTPTRMCAASRFTDTEVLVTCQNASGAGAATSFTFVIYDMT